MKYKIYIHTYVYVYKKGKQSGKVGMTFKTKHHEQDEHRTT